MFSVCGKELPCRMTMGAMLQFKRATGRDVSQMDTSDVEDLLMLMWCCISSACRADGVEFGMDFEAFCDQLTPADLTRWNEMMADGEGQKKTES